MSLATSRNVEVEKEVGLMQPIMYWMFAYCPLRKEPKNVTLY